MVDSQTSSVGEEYEGVPLIYKLDFGFYSVPKKESIEGYIESVDNGLVVQHEHFSPPAYMSSDVYIRTEDGVQTSGDHYAPVDEYCTLDPYVDRIRWRIDDASTSPFPDNVQPFRHDSDFR